MSRHHVQPPDLRPFLRALDERLDGLSHDELKAALRAHARDLGRRDRSEFLRIFPERGRRPPKDERTQASPQDHLLADVEGFLGRLEAGEFESAWDLRGGRWSREGSSEWGHDMADLFRRADRAFLDGAKDVAGKAYGRLLHSFSDERYLEGFGWEEVPEPEREMEADLGECEARHLRCVVDVGDPERAAERLRDELDEHGTHDLLAFRLQRVLDADARPLADRQGFLESWQRVLEERPLSPTPWGEDPNAALQREAAVLRGGVTGLAALARARADAAAYAQWSDALLAEGDVDAALAAAREGVRRVADREKRAPLADRASRLAEQRGDEKAAMDAARTAWRSRPTLPRLLRVCELGDGVAAAVRRRARAEVRRLKELPRTDGQLTAILLLLAGEHERALRRLRRLVPLGWSGGDHAGPILVPFALVAGAGPQGPPPDSGLAALWQAIDHLHRWRDGDAALDELMADEELDVDEEDAFATAEGVTAGERLRRLLAPVAERVPKAQREAYLRAARGGCEARFEAIASARHRKAYARAATLLVACGEALTLAGRAGDARDLVLGLRERHRRKHALRGEVDHACARSSILSREAEE